MQEHTSAGSLAVYAQDPENEIQARHLSEQLHLPYHGDWKKQAIFGESSIHDGSDISARSLPPAGSALCTAAAKASVPDTWLAVTNEGIFLEAGDVRIRGDFSRMLPRIRPALLRSELLVKAAGINKTRHDPGICRAIDATAGLGEDAFLLAAAGFFVTMYEKDPVIAAMLRDAMERAAADERMTEILSRMTLEAQDSIEALRRMKDDPGAQVDVILLDPMFPERRKSASVKKKFQLLHILERPCEEEAELVQAAIDAAPGRILIKRPVKGAWLAGVKPSFSLTGKAVRIDCLLPQQL